MTFADEVRQRISQNERNAPLRSAARQFMVESFAAKYSYNFHWMGRPVIQYPQDIVAMQELVWRVKPDLVVETGIAHGGSLVLYASLLELNAACGGPANATVVGVDIDIRAHNRKAIEEHPMHQRIAMLEGSSIDPGIVDKIRALAETRQRVMVCLDSNHEHDHVLSELEAYGPLTSVGSYCVVFDTVIEDLPNQLLEDRPWATGNNPATAVTTFLAEHPEFELDSSVGAQLLITVASKGFLRRVAR